MGSAYNGMTARCCNTQLSSQKSLFARCFSYKEWQNPQHPQIIPYIMALATNPLCECVNQRRFVTFNVSKPRVITVAAKSFKTFYLIIIFVKYIYRKTHVNNNTAYYICRFEVYRSGWLKLDPVFFANMITWRVILSPLTKSFKETLHCRHELSAWCFLELA